jgi:glyoxylase-like metal-dependent hydrolase (beta-lactamase superfamily II)
MLIKDPPVAVTGKLWMLGTTAYPVYLLLGESEAAIIEGGIGAAGPILREQIERAGIRPELVKQVIVTHAHPDHVMAVPQFREMFPGVTVVASELAAKTLAAEKAIAMFRQVDEALCASLARLGRIAEEHRPQPFAGSRIAVDRAVSEGDVIAIDGHGLQVLATPGHSDCSLSFYEPAERLLLISDATGYYMPERGAWWPNYFSDYAAYLASMRRLAALPAEVLCLSHNGAICGADDVRTYFAAAIAATEAYHQRIVAQARSGRSLRQIAEDLGTEAHNQAPVLPVDFFQKNCGLLVKQSLRHEGIEIPK